MPSAFIERLTLALDAGRSVWFRWICRSSLVRATLRHKDRRIATLASLNITLAAVGATYFPVLLFTLGPILLGVAHVAADVRYLVLRRKLARWWQNVALAGCVLLLSVRALEALGVIQRIQRLELGLAAGFVAAALFAGVAAAGSRARAAAGLALLAGVAGLAWQHPATAPLVFLHAHNVIALLAWALLFRRQKSWLVAPLSLIGLAATVLASGALAKQTLASPFVASFHLHVFAIADGLAPFHSARAAVGVTTAYVFLQSVHYSTWLSWIPQEEQPAEGTPTFRMSLRYLLRDLGAPGVASTVLVMVAVGLGACFQLQRTRALYLSLATFHGYLELALLAYLWTRGSSQGPARVQAPVPAV
jgi:hypothetical protein